jgi:hypothetical protein
MPKINQLFFKHEEIVELLIKKADLHHGKWVLSLNFGMSPGNFGLTPEQSVPGIVVAVTGIGLVRGGPDTPEAIQVDASVVNPAANKPRKRSSEPK